MISRYYIEDWRVT